MASSNTDPLSSGEIEMINRVLSRFPNNEPTKFFFFYSGASAFSNFHPSPFEEDGLKFKFNETVHDVPQSESVCSILLLPRRQRWVIGLELFGDNETAEKILKADDPKRCKGLGRSAFGFDPQTWHEHRSKIVSQGIYLKVSEGRSIDSVAWTQHSLLRYL